MGTIVLSPSTSPAVKLLAQLLWNACGGQTIQTGGWPFAPDSLDFSSLGNLGITIDAQSGAVRFSFAASKAPVFHATLDIGLLEAQVTGSPNYFSVSNDGLSGRPGALSGSSVSFGGTYSAITRQKSGIVRVTGQLNGIQSAQGVVNVALYRDSGPSQVQLGSWAVAPGGLSNFNWAASISAIDVLPDSNPHEYFLVATGSGGIVLTVPLNVAGTTPASLQAFELGGPG